MLQASGAGAGEGGVNGNVDKNKDSVQDRPKFTLDSFLAFFALRSIIGARFGDGITRVQPGERLRCTDVDPHREWDRLPKDVSPEKVEEIVGRRPRLASEKKWVVFDRGCLDADKEGVGFTGVEGREVPYSDDDLRACVVVLWEGVALPTRALLRVVNNAHAVLVLGEDKEYSYLHDGFVLSAREEEALVEWGVGRSLFANSCLAVGGTAMVAFAEKIWEPAVLGTLLVAAAGYRVQGVVTKVWRVRSHEWESGHQLVPSGIHGIERVVQGVLLTSVALADLLGDRWLLGTLIVASVHVVVLENLGHAYLTGGQEKYKGIVCTQMILWTCMCAGVAAWLWLAYVFAGFVFCVVCGLGLASLYASYVFAVDGGDDENLYDSLSPRVISLIVASAFVGVWPAMLGWDDANLKFSWLSLQPWRWPLTTLPDSFSTGVRFVGLVFGATGGALLVSYVIFGVLSFRISNDAGKAVGSVKRMRERKKHSRGFSHFREQSIPSRNLLVTDVAAIV